jgi:hypothetical protein
MAVTCNNRYTRTNTFVRWGMTVTYNRYKFVTASIPKRLRNGRVTSASETATWIQKWFKIPAGTSREPYMLNKDLDVLRHMTMYQVYCIAC